MDSFEVAAKLASAYNYCKGSQCPFVSSCKGGITANCQMKELAMLLRAKEAEIDTLKLTVGALRDMLLMLQNYASDLEKINNRYRNLVIAFQRGYRPQRKLSHTKHTKPGMTKKKKYKQEELIAMDGDERYGLPKPPSNYVKQEMVVI